MSFFLSIASGIFLKFDLELDGKKYKPENMIGTKGVGKVLGGNGGKFQERTSSPREGVAHWRGASTAIFPLSSPTLQPSFANLCHPG